MMALLNVSSLESVFFEKLDTERNTYGGQNKMDYKKKGKVMIEGPTGEQEAGSGVQG